MTDVLRYGNEGKNAILVKVDAREYEGWWYDGCGIYRHVWLIKTDSSTSTGLEPLLLRPRFLKKQLL